MADKEEVEPAAEPSSAELSGASQTSADLKASRTEVNGAAVNGSETAKEARTGTTHSRGRSWSPLVSRCCYLGASAKTGTGGATKGTKGRSPKGAPTNKRDQPVKPERTTPVKFVRQSIGELRKVVYPTGRS